MSALLRMLEAFRRVGSTCVKHSHIHVWAIRGQADKRASAQEEKKRSEQRNEPASKLSEREWRNMKPKLFLLSHNAEMCECWRREFFDVEGVEVVCEEFDAFMRQRRADFDAFLADIAADTTSIYVGDVQIVCPGNSHGILTGGGYGGAVGRYFGKYLQPHLWEQIGMTWRGEAPVASVTAFQHTGDDAGDPMRNHEEQLMYVPVTRVPGAIRDRQVIYDITRATLGACDLRRDVIVMPAFGAGNGGIPREVVARLMRLAYESTANPSPKDELADALAWEAKIEAACHVG